MKIVVLVVLVLAIAKSAKAADACHLREIDLCTATGMFHFQVHGVPETEEDIDSWCETVKEVSECSGNYSAKCLSPLQRELIGLFAGGGDDLRDQLCTSGTELRSRYLKHGECLSNGAQSDTFKGHVQDLQVSVESVFDAPFKDRLPTLCCGFRRFHGNVEKSTEEMCGADSVDMLKFIMDMIITELPQTLCRSYDPNSNECQRLLPPLGATPKGTKGRSQIGKLMGTIFEQS